LESGPGDRLQEPPFSHQFLGSGRTAVAPQLSLDLRDSGSQLPGEDIDPPHTGPLTRRSVGARGRGTHTGTGCASLRPVLSFEPGAVGARNSAAAGSRRPGAGARCAGRPDAPIRPQSLNRSPIANFGF